MDPLERLAHAKRITREYLEDGLEYSFVYEDEALEDASDEDLTEIHKLAVDCLNWLVGKVGSR